MKRSSAPVGPLNSEQPPQEGSNAPASRCPHPVRPACAELRAHHPSDHASVASRVCASRPDAAPTGCAHMHPRQVWSLHVAHPLLCRPSISQLLLPHQDTVRQVVRACAGGARGPPRAQCPRPSSTEQGARGLHKRPPPPHSSIFLQDLFVVKLSQAGQSFHNQTFPTSQFAGDGRASTAVGRSQPIHRLV